MNAVLRRMQKAYRHVHPRQLLRLIRTKLGLCALLHIHRAIDSVAAQVQGLKLLDRIERDQSHDAVIDDIGRALQNSAECG